MEIDKKPDKIFTHIKNNPFFYILLIANILLLFQFINPIQQIGGPIYGGDLYFFMGHTIHLYEGGSVFQSSHDALSYEAYPWFYHWIDAVSAKLFSQDIYSYNIYVLPFIFGLLSFVLAYLLFRLIFKDKLFSLIMAEYWFALKFILFYTASGFADRIMLLLIPISILSYFQKKSNLKLFSIAIVIGISGMTHLHLFTFAFMFFSIMALIDLYKDKEKRKENTIKYSSVLVGGFLIGLIYLCVPLLIYRGQTVNNWQQYTAGFMTLSRFLPYVYGSLARSFIGKVLTVLGIVLFFNLKNKKKFYPALYITLIGLFGIFHPIITNPIIGTDFGWYKYGSVSQLGFFIFFALFWYYIFNISKAYMGKLLNHKLIVTAIVLIAFFASLYFIISPRIDNDRWSQLAYSEENSNYARSIYDTISYHTDVDDVFIGEHGETLFSLNAVSGRKILFMRRTHFTPFVDVDKRIADAAVILYGNDSKKSQELINEYNILYYYTDYYAIQNKAQCLQNWDNFNNSAYHEMSYSCLRTDPVYEDYLNSYGIETKVVHARKDVSHDQAMKFDLLIVKPLDFANINYTVLNNPGADGFILGEIN